MPPQSLIPVERGYKYVAARDAIDPVNRPEREIKDRYANLIAQVTLRTVHEVLISTPASVVEAVTFYGYVSSTDPGTGRPAQPLLLNVTAQRAKFEAFVLAALDPVACLKGELTALVSPHPYDLEPVEAPVFGGLCVIQAKRSRNAVGIDVVRALAGTMEDKHATKGVVVTTSWVTKDGHDFAVRHGRIEIMECDHLKYLCKEHLGLDVLISLPKPPPSRR